MKKYFTKQDDLIGCCFVFTYFIVLLNESGLIYFEIFLRNLLIMINPKNKTITDYGKLIMSQNKIKKRKIIRFLIYIFLVMVDFILLISLIEPKYLIVPFIVQIFERFILHFFFEIYFVYNYG